MACKYKIVIGVKKKYVLIFLAWCEKMQHWDHHLVCQTNEINFPFSAQCSLASYLSIKQNKEHKYT